MIRIGIICKDTAQIEEITNLIYNYIHMPPRHHMKGLTDWQFPLLSIESISVVLMVIMVLGVIITFIYIVSKDSKTGKAKISLPESLIIFV